MSTQDVSGTVNLERQFTEIVEQYSDLAYDQKNDPEDAAVNSELRSTLEGGLDVLSPDLRAVVVLRDIQGLSTEESAEASDISVASLKSRLHRARVQLRKHLQE
jgi:RNA polymerase sigma-70 factor (ECF subfamily)